MYLYVGGGGRDESRMHVQLCCTYLPCMNTNCVFRNSHCLLSVGCHSGALRARLERRSSTSAHYDDLPAARSSAFLRFASYHI